MQDIGGFVSVQNGLDVKNGPGRRLVSVDVAVPDASQGAVQGFLARSFLRFERTEPLELLLFQSPIRHTIGVDYGIGVEYRPPLTENMVLTGGASALTPGQISTMSFPTSSGRKTVRWKSAEWRFHRIIR